MTQFPVAQWRLDRWMVLLTALVTVAAGCSSDTGSTATPTTSPTTAPASIGATTSAPVTTPRPTTTTIAGTAHIEGTLTAAELASQLDSIELAAAGGDATVGERQQLAYRYLSAHSELDDGVLGGVTSTVRPYVERIVRARQFGQARQTANANPAPPSDTLPAWTIVDPLPADELIADYRVAEEATGIAWYWLAAIHFQETRMGRIKGVSSAGAVGPMQFLPTTWERCCHGDPTVTRDAIIGAATYLAQNGGPDDMQGALHVYNPNDTYVTTVTAFAENLRDNPNLYAAYHAWQVFYSTSAGTIRLPVGYSQTQPVDAATYLASHPHDAG